MLLSWLILTNHCALGMMRPTRKAEVEHSCCHGGSHKPANKAPEVPQQCCKDIKASLASVDAKLHLPAEEYVFFIALIFPRELLQSVAMVSFEHGPPPPRAVSFAELVLQRSLLSHAPPQFV